MGLRQSDLKHCIESTIEIDSYKSKMGEDKDIVVLSFAVKGENPADDLVKFVESGYDFVLDADKTSGEQADGKFRVFVELERNKKIPNSILEIIDGVKKLSEISDFRFRYYKNFKSSTVDETNLSEQVPLDAESYEIKINETQLENYKNFFQNSYVDEIVMNESRITFFKKYAQPMSFDFETFGNTEDIQKQITESFDVNKMPEVMFLSKFIGDFNIQIYGDKYLFETSNKSVVLYNKQYEPK
tara:strand:- start:2762 stop:3490 length:729 start_codon:yes stop_codon:yes gene_type:complete